MESRLLKNDPSRENRRKGEKEMGKYISEIIGETFKSWRKNEVVFIAAPTGSGKTMFVLYDLVEYAALQGDKVLYLVNRALLKDQINEIINMTVKPELRKNHIPEEKIRNVIAVKTYQEIEQSCKSQKNIFEEDNRYRYIVADEAHYFLTDSLFNTNTAISFNWIKERREKCTLIFMSATIDRIKEYIITNCKLQPFDKKNRAEAVRGDIPQQCRYREYAGEADYSWVNLRGLNGLEQIPDLIKKSTGKWLIFVDSISKGKEIQKILLKEEIQNKFVEARTKYDEDVQEDIQGIIKKKSFAQQVLIATSVLDNGVSIKDYELRNMIIMTDTDEEFIQMLGRKRLLDEEKRNAEKVNIYISPKNKKEFEEKHRYFKEKIRFVSEQNIEADVNIVLEKIMQGRRYYENTRCLGYVQEGKMYWNHLSIAQCDSLYGYYQKIVEKFQEDEDNAFLKEQASWVGKTNADIIKLIEESCEDKKAVFAKRLEESLEKIIEENQDGLTKSQYSNWKTDMKEGIWCFIKDQEGITDNDKKYLGQNDRPLSVEDFALCMKKAGLKYKVKVEGKKDQTRYIIS